MTKNQKTKVRPPDLDSFDGHVRWALTLEIKSNIQKGPQRQFTTAADFDMIAENAISHIPRIGQLPCLNFNSPSSRKA